MLWTGRHSAFTRDAWLGELRATLALGWPMVLTNLAQVALTTVNIVTVGHLGPSSLAAATLGVNLYFGLLIFAIGLVSATSPMMAEAIGRGHQVVREVRRTFRQGLWSAVIVSIPAWTLLWHADMVLLALGQEPQLAADAHTFMRELQWGFLPALGFIALRSFVAAMERPIWATMVTAATILFHILANWALVFGHLGLPALGLRGSGLATTLSNTFLFLGLVVVVSVDPRFRRFHLFGRWWRPDWPRLATLWRLGVPIGATMALEVTLFNGAVFLMGQFGAVAIAAHSIAIQIAAASFMVPLGLGQAATVRVGLAHGAGLVDNVTRAGWAAFALAIAFMAMMSIVLLSVPRPLIGVFVDPGDPANAGVIETATMFLLWAAIFQIADGAQAVGAGMLRGLQDTRMPMLYAAFGYWGCGMPLALFFAFYMQLGGVGIWMGLASGLAIVACLIMRRWSRRQQLGLVPPA